MESAPGPARVEPDVDVLTDVLRALRLRGTAYFQAEFGAPWGMSIAREDVANFHVVTAGCCHASWDEGAGECRLEAGDIVVFPHGLAHALRDTAHTPAVPAAQLLGGRRTKSGGGIAFGGPGERSEIICGHFELDRAVSHPLLTALPRVLRLRSGEGTDPEWVATATRLAVLESTSARPGSSAVVDRLAEALMIQLIRAHAERSAMSTGFLAALSDPVVGAALGAMHECPEALWSVDMLARKIGASRSSFAARFKRVVGTSPMQYLTDWRMQGARELLRRDALSVAEVAERVGYTSEFAFAKAYKRAFGEGPGATRRNAS